MNADVKFGPVKAGIPAEAEGVLHIAEAVFDVILGAIGVDDLFVGPGVVVGKENGFAEHGSAEASESIGVDGIVQAHIAAIFLDVDGDEFRHMFACEELANLGLDTRQCWFAAMADSAVRPPLELGLKFMEVGAGFSQVPADALELSIEEVGVKGDQDGAFGREDGALDTEGLHVLEVVTGQRMKAAHRDAEQVGALVGT